MDLATIRSRIAEHGLSYRGAFHPTAGETLVLVGFVGSENWPTFAASQEAGDGRPDPLDRWSTRVITQVAGLLGATPLFPFGGPPFLPFQRWAQQAEPVHPSPLGILIHPEWGLWHAYRGALAFAERIDLPPPDRRASPCDSCRDKPCLSTCPVDAFTSRGFNVLACVAHIRTAAGADCVTTGCRARRACPVGVQYRHVPEQAEFHQRAFIGAQKS